jgi:hypothetical protein
LAAGFFAATCDEVTFAGEVDFDEGVVFEVVDFPAVDVFGGEDDFLGAACCPQAEPIPASKTASAEPSQMPMRVRFILSRLTNKRGRGERPRPRESF